MSAIPCHTLFVEYGYRAREIVTTAKIGPAFASGEFVPYPQEFRAVWDTGAMGTTVSASLAEKLGLARIGLTEVEGVTGKAVCNTYLISLALPNGIVIPELEVADCEGNIGCDVLIGMDVIGMGDFAVCNVGGNTTFTFRIPSVAVVDFTAASDPAYAAAPRSAKPGRNDPCPCGSGLEFKKCHGRSSG